MTVDRSGSTSSAPSQNRVGWIWVMAQFVLLGVWIVLLQPFDIRSLAPNGVEVPLRIGGAAIAVAGAVYSLVAALWLGRQLTPLPVPKSGSDLVKTGPYRNVRHPIYGGLILMIWGATLFAFRPLPVIAAIVLPAFFLAKSRFEERLLSETFSDYSAFASRRHRFIPWIW